MSYALEDWISRLRLCFLSKLRICAFSGLPVCILSEDELLTPRVVLLLCMASETYVLNSGLW